MKVQALLTDMDQPLGFTIGNALEIMEASQTLQGQGPPDLTGLAVEAAARMIFMGNPLISIDSAREQANTALEDGSALEVLRNVIAAQGGNANVLQQFESLPNASGEHVITSPRDGYISRINADDIGRAAGAVGRRPLPTRKIKSTPRSALSCKPKWATTWSPARDSARSTTPTRRTWPRPCNWSRMRSACRPTCPSPRDLVLDLIQ